MSCELFGAKSDVSSLGQAILQVKSGRVGGLIEINGQETGEREIERGRSFTRPPLPLSRARCSARHSSVSGAWLSAFFRAGMHAWMLKCICAVMHAR